MVSARLDSYGCTREVAEHERSVRDEAIAACNSISSIPRWLNSPLVSSIAFTAKTFAAETQTRITLGAMLNRPRHFRQARPCVHHGYLTGMRQDQRERYVIIRVHLYTHGEKAGYHSVESSNVARDRCHIRVEFAASRLCCEMFFSVYSGFPLSPKTNIDLISSFLIRELLNPEALKL